MRKRVPAEWRGMVLRFSVSESFFCGTAVAELAELGCDVRNCTELFAAFTEHPTWNCDGTPNMFAGGSWIGHLLPGILFFLWATHWLFGIFRCYFASRQRSEPYQSKATQTLLWFNWPLEAIVKVTLPPFAIAAELYLAHHFRYRRLICDDVHSTIPTYRAGHFDGHTVNNWQHASIYPAFIVSGIVDLVAPSVKAPEGTPMAYLSLSFLAEALLMGLHKKHSPLDREVHQYLFIAMLATAGFSAAEVACPTSFLLSCGRVASTYLQGLWFIAAAHIIFEGHTAWDPSNNDLAPAMYTPVLFISFVALVPLALLMVWVLMNVSYTRYSRQHVKHHGMYSLPVSHDPNHRDAGSSDGGSSDCYDMRVTWEEA